MHIQDFIKGKSVYYNKYGHIKNEAADILFSIRDMVPESTDLNELPDVQLFIARWFAEAANDKLKSDWKKIESAPKTGIILVTDGEDLAQVSWSDGHKCWLLIVYESNGWPQELPFTPLFWRYMIQLPTPKETIEP